ncbi:hypothetical protein KXW38_002020, partial [Aspergillus fumigatus]
HRGDVGIGTRGINPIGLARRARLLRARTESARHQLDLAVQFRRDPVHRADKRTRPTTDHSHPKTSQDCSPSRRVSSGLKWTDGKCADLKAGIQKPGASKTGGRHQKGCDHPRQVLQQHIPVAFPCRGRGRTKAEIAGNRR